MCFIDIDISGLARQMMENVYDLVVLDDHEDFTKKVSESLLDGILGILDGFVVFQEGQSEGEWAEMAKMAFDILLECAENTKDLEFCAIATAKLHSLVQTRAESPVEEAGFLIYRTNRIIQNALQRNDMDHYAFLGKPHINFKKNLKMSSKSWPHLKNIKLLHFLTTPL